MAALDGRRIWLVGIGGAGLSAYALLARAWGAEVAGWDRNETPYLVPVRNAGIEVTISPEPKAPAGWEVFVSSAYADVPGRPRAELLTELVAAGEAIVVAGAHGKTTTAAMIAFVLRDHRPRPELDRRRRGAPARRERRRGGGVARGRGRRVGPVGLRLVPSGGGSDERRPRPPLGVRLAGGGGGALRALVGRGARGRPRLGARAARRGAGGSGRAQPSQCRGRGCGGRARRGTAGRSDRGSRVLRGGRAEIRARRQRQAGSTSTTTTRTTRRSCAQPLRPRGGGAAAGCSCSSSLTCYSRTLHSGAELGRELAAADVVAVTDVYPAREQPLEGVTGKLVIDALCDARPGFAPGWIPRLDDGVRFLVRRARAGDLVLAVGAGDVDRAARADPRAARGDRDALHLRSRLCHGPASHIRRPPVTPPLRFFAVRLAPWDGEVGRSHRRPEADSSDEAA